MRVLRAGDLLLGRSRLVQRFDGRDGLRGKLGRRWRPHPRDVVVERGKRLVEPSLVRRRHLLLGARCGREVVLGCRRALQHVALGRRLVVQFVRRFVCRRLIGESRRMRWRKGGRGLEWLGRGLGRLIPRMLRGKDCSGGRDRSGGGEGRHRIGARHADGTRHGHGVGCRFGKRRRVGTRQRIEAGSGIQLRDRLVPGERHDGRFRLELGHRLQAERHHFDQHAADHAERNRNEAAAEQDRARDHGRPAALDLDHRIAGHDRANADQRHRRAERQHEIAHHVLAGGRISADPVLHCGHSTFKLRYLQKSNTKCFAAR